MNILRFPHKKRIKRSLINTQGSLFVSYKIWHKNSKGELIEAADIARVEDIIIVEDE